MTIYSKTFTNGLSGDMRRHIRQDGLKGMRRLEIRAVVMAADQRGGLEELDEAVEMGE